MTELIFYRMNRRSLKHVLIVLSFFMKLNVYTLYFADAPTTSDINNLNLEQGSSGIPAYSSVLIEGNQSASGKLS